MDIYSQLIRHQTEKYLTASQVRAISTCNVRVIHYEELVNYEDIDDLLKGDIGIVILYQVSKYSGHYVCLLKKGDLIEFCDSYGFKPDDELIYCEYDKKLNKKLLLTLLQNEERRHNKVIYNTYKLQSSSQSVGTCGRYCGLRLAFRNFNQSQFINIFKTSKMNNDTLAVLMTMSQTL